MRRHSERGPASRRPLADDDDAFQLDDGPKRYKTGFSKPASVRAPAGGLPEVERSAGDVDPERKLRARDEIEDNVAPPPAEADARALSVRPPLNLPAMPLLVPDVPVKRPRVLVMLGVAVGVLLAIIFITRPGCIFANSSKQLQAGTVVSKHLGLAWEFPEPSIQDERLDASETTTDGWKRRVSIYYRGSSATNFQSQLVILVFEKPGTTATDDQARQLGANEVVQASRRECSTIEFRGIVATRCLALAARPGQALGVIETSFLLDGRAIFLRSQHELNIPAAPRTPEEMEQHGRILQDGLDQQREAADKVMTSMRTLRR